MREWQKRTDPVTRRIPDATPTEFVDWMIKHHGLPEAARATVESNLREQFQWHRLQGRLDQRPTMALFAQLLLVRGALKKLEKPDWQNY